MEMKKYKLGDVLEEFHSGNNIKAADIKDVGEYPVFGANGLRGYTDRYNCDGDVAIIGRQGAYCGNVKFFSGKAYYTEHAVIAKPKKGFDAKYLACKLPFYQLEKYQGQSAQPGLSVGTLSLIEVELPSYENQKEVALVLSALDKRIENLRAQNRVLEQTAKTIYDYTFLQCAGHQTTYNKTLNRNIPADWEVKKLGEIADFKNGINYDPSKPGDKKTKIVNVRNVSSSTYFISETDLDDLFVDEKHAAKYYVSQDDILITRSGTPGAARMIAPSKEPVVYCGFIIKMTFDDKKMKNYLFFKMKELEFAIQKQSAGSILSNISQDILNNLEIVIPDVKTLNDFNAQIAPLLKKQLVNTKQIEALTTQRNTLLPLLMTGQIEV